MFRHRKIVTLVAALVLTIAACKKASDNNSTPPPVVVNPPVPRDTTFTNPLLSSGPDPWVIQQDSLYYYTNTSGDRIKLWRTTSLSKLNNAYNQTVWTKPATGPNSQNIWAPELHRLDGKWYLYYTGGSSTDQKTQRLFVLENTSPDPFTGTWTDKGKIADPAADFFAIDATVFENAGKRYLVWSGNPSASDNTQNLYIAEMSNPWTLATPRSLISSPQYKWETNGASPVSQLPQVNEGPEILRNPAGKTFLIFSASGCWTDDYALGMMSLKDGGDPMNRVDWIKSSNPVFVKDPQANAYGPGHNAFFLSPDKKENWIIYHANPQPGQQCSDTRSPRIQKFGWTSDGNPDFGKPAPINIPALRPSGEKN